MQISVTAVGWQGLLWHTGVLLASASALFYNSSPICHQVSSCQWWYFSPSLSEPAPQEPCPIPTTWGQGLTLLTVSFWSPSCLLSKLFSAACSWHPGCLRLFLQSAKSRLIPNRGLLVFWGATLLALLQFPLAVLPSLQTAGTAGSHRLSCVPAGAVSAVGPG